MVTLIQESLSDHTLNEVLAFVRQSNPFAQRTWGWDTGRFLDWRWGSDVPHAKAEPGWFGRNCQVFRQGSEIRAVVVAEYGGPEIAVITRGEDPEGVDTVLRLLRENRADTPVLVVSNEAVWLTSTLERFGFTINGLDGCEWEYDLEFPREAVAIPDGFSVESLAEPRRGDHERIAECIQRAFGSEHDPLPGLRSIESSPGFRSELSVFVRSPDGRVAAYCRGTVDAHNGIGGIDPVCTHPEFQRLGLGKAVVLACFDRQRNLGGRYTYVGSGPEPAPGTHLYRSLEPSHKTIMSAWRLGG